MLNSRTVATLQEGKFKKFEKQLSTKNSVPRKIIPEAKKETK